MSPRDVPRRTLAIALGIGFGSLLTIVAVLRDRAKPARASPRFRVQELESTKLRVLPFRQSGLIFHWAEDSPAVYVRRAQWDALSDDARRQLGQSIAIAKGKGGITVFDETLKTRLAICTAKGRCTRAVE